MLQCGFYYSWVEPDHDGLVIAGSIILLCITNLKIGEGEFNATSSNIIGPYGSS